MTNRQDHRVPPPMVSAILLAAGESRRMVEFKQLLPFAGKTFVESCVDTLLASRAGEVIVVTGHRDADVRNALRDRPVRALYNPDYRDGMASSVKCGVASASPSTAAVLIALSDQPQIGVGIVNRVIARYEQDRPRIVVPMFGRRGGHPILIDLSLKDELLTFDASYGLKQVVEAHYNEVARFDAGDPGVLADFDYPEDYARLVDRQD